MFFHLRQVYSGLIERASVSMGWRPRTRVRPDVADRLESLLDAVFQLARETAPEIFAEKMPSEIRQKERFALVMPFVAMAIVRLDEAEVRQALVERLINRLEVGLREAGVGDIGVSHRMRAMAGTINGRLQRYVPLMAAENRDELRAVLAEHKVPHADDVLRLMVPDAKV